MKIGALAATMAVVLAAANAPLKAETIEERVARLEAENRAQEAALKRQEATIAEQKQLMEGAPEKVKKLAEDLETKREEAKTDPKSAWFKNIEISGLIEVEASYVSPYEGDSTSDLVLSTFELGIASQVTDWVKVTGSLLYEQYDTPLEVDVAFITLGNVEQFPAFFTAGQIYVPFGAYETNLISDPLTLEIGETRETAAQLGFVQGDFSGSAYLFNGDNHIDGKDQLGSWGANLGYAHEEDDRAWAFGIGYISDLGDSDSLQGIVADNRDLAYWTGIEEGADPDWLSIDPTERTGGWTANAAATFGAFNVIGEYLSATEAFDIYSLGFKDKGAKPSAWNVELGYTFEVFGKESVAAAAYQGTDEALGLELPKQRWSVGWAVGIYKNTTLAFEWAYDEDYSIDDGGTGRSANTALAKLAVEF